MFRRLPMRLGQRNLPLPCFRQAKQQFALIFSALDMNPAILAQYGQGTCERRTVHGKAGAQRFLVDLARDRKRGEQSVLGDLDSSLAEFLVIDTRDEPRYATKILTCAGESKERVCRMIAANRDIHDKMYNIFSCSALR